MHHCSIYGSLSLYLVRLLLLADLDYLYTVNRTRALWKSSINTSTILSTPTHVFVEHCTHTLLLTPSGILPVYTPILLLLYYLILQAGSF